MAGPVADSFCLLSYCTRTLVSKAAPGLPAWIYCTPSFITSKILLQDAGQRNQTQGKSITESHSKKGEYGLLISPLPADWNAWNVAVHPGLCKCRQVLHNREQKKTQGAQILATSCLCICCTLFLALVDF